MRFKVKRFEASRVRNVHGKVISRSYFYVIVVIRWFRSPRYLRLVPGWIDKYSQDQPCNVELVRFISHATSFKEAGGLDKKIAEDIIKRIKAEPDKFIMY